MAHPSGCRKEDKTLGWSTSDDGHVFNYLRSIRNVSLMILTVRGLDLHI